MSVLPGREAALAIIDAHLDAACGGAGSVLLLSGEAGIGKTTLLGAAAASAVTRGMRTVHGSCWDGPSAPLHWLWLQVLRALEVPDAEPLVHGRHGPPSIERAGAGIAGALVDAAGRQPLAVLLDDLHDGGADAIRVLPLIAARLREQPLVVIGAYRNSTARAAEGVPQVLQALARAHTHLPLTGLDADAVTSLLAAHGRQPSPQLAARVHLASAGNPLLVSLLARSTATDASATAVVVGADHEQFLERDPPEELRAHVRGQLEALPPETRALLGCSAVLAGSAAVAVVASAEGLDEATVGALLAPAVEEGVLTMAEDGAIAFRHALVRSALYADLELADRAALHKRAADALAPLVADRARVEAEIAHHRYHAAFDHGDASDLGGVLSALRAAADEARRGGAIEEAVRLLAHAAGCAELAGASSSVRGRILLELAALQERIDDPRALTTWEAAVALARVAGDPALLARAAIGSTRSALFLGIVNERQVTTLEEALDALGDQDPPVRAELLGHLASALVWTPERARSMALADEAVRIARETGVPRALAGALLARHYVTRGPEHALERTGIAAEAAMAADATGDDELSALARSALVVDHREAGDCEAADRAISALADWAAISGHAPGSWMAAAHGLVSALLDGDIEREAALAPDVQQAAAGNREMAFLIDFARVMTDLRPLGEHWRFLVRSRARRLPMVPSWRARALLDAAQEGADGATAELADVITALQVRRNNDSHWLLAAALAAEATVLLGDAERAGQLLRMLDGQAGTSIVAGRVGATRGSISHHLGILCLTVGRTADAMAHLRDAEQQHGAPGFGAHLRRTRAALVTARVTPGPTPVPLLLTRSGAYWSLSNEVRSLTLPHSVGMGYLAALVGMPGTEIAALDLHRLGAGAAPGAPADALAVDLGGADAVLDAPAKRAYRGRMAAIDTELGALVGPSDAARRARLDEERRAIVTALQGAIGLGGRDRRLASEAERARTSVTKALRAAVDRISVVDEALGTHLDASLRTGTRCCYAPDGPPLLRTVAG